MKKTDVSYPVLLVMCIAQASIVIGLSWMLFELLTIPGDEFNQGIMFFYGCLAAVPVGLFIGIFNVIQLRSGRLDDRRKRLAIINVLLATAILAPGLFFMAQP